MLSVGFLDSYWAPGLDLSMVGQDEMDPRSFAELSFALAFKRQGF